MDRRQFLALAGTAAAVAAVAPVVDIVEVVAPAAPAPAVPLPFTIDALDVVLTMMDGTQKRFGDVKVTFMPEPYPSYQFERRDFTPDRPAHVTAVTFEDKQFGKLYSQNLNFNLLPGDTFVCQPRMEFTS